LIADQPSDEIDLTRLEDATSRGIVIDAGHLAQSEADVASALAAFTAGIRAMRRLPPGGTLVARHTDAALLAALVGRDPDDLLRWLVRARPLIPGLLHAESSPDAEHSHHDETSRAGS
jgi:hypothetical protein